MQSALRGRTKTPSPLLDGHIERDDPTIFVITPDIAQPAVRSSGQLRRSSRSVASATCSPPLLAPTLGSRRSPCPASPRSPHSPSLISFPFGKDSAARNDSRPSLALSMGSRSMRPSLSQPSAPFGRGGANRLRRAEDDDYTASSPRTWSRGGDDSSCLPGPGGASGPMGTRFRAGSMDALRPLARVPLPPLRRSESAARPGHEVWEDYEGKSLRSPSSYPSIRRVKSEALGAMHKMFDKK